MSANHAARLSALGLELLELDGEEAFSVLDPKTRKIVAEGKANDIEDWLVIQEKDGASKQRYTSEKHIEVFNTREKRMKPIHVTERLLIDALALLKLMYGADQEGHDVGTLELSAVLETVIPKISEALKKLDSYGIDDMQRELVRAGLRGGDS